MMMSSNRHPTSNKITTALVLMLMLFLATLQPVSALSCNLCDDSAFPYDYVPDEKKDELVTLTGYGRHNCGGFYVAAKQQNMITSQNTCNQLKTEFGHTCCTDEETNGGTGETVIDVGSNSGSNQETTGGVTTITTNTNAPQENLSAASTEGRLASCLQVKEYEELLGALYQVICGCSETGVLSCTHFDSEIQSREVCYPKDVTCDTTSDCCGILACKEGKCSHSAATTSTTTNEQTHSPITSNSMMNEECPSGQVSVVFQITTDDKPEEITWEVSFPNSQNYLNMQNWYNIGDQKAFIDSRCMPAASCLSLSIHDAGGDGLLDGGYTLTVGGNTVVDERGAPGLFQSTVSYSFNCGPARKLRGSTVAGH
mmetsp:Transcript_20878/g.39027  ORF Transcript_20878/g.39027 Transcript_20878/m.39027 type:complete len:370 (-) Transcript_20878:74-1183(-)